MIRKSSAIALLAILVACFAHAQSNNSAAPKERHFRFTYAFTVRSPQQGSPLRVWFPMATSDDYQTVKEVSAKGDLPLKRSREKEYGNSIFYAETQKATKDEYHFEVVYDVVRRERFGLRDGHPIGGAKVVSAKYERFLQPDKLVPVSGLPAELAAKETAGAKTVLDRAHAIYNYVFSTVKYDKSGTGWGRGDTMWVCDAKRGNCTDFHSLFASMARSQKIPTRFEIGFPLPQTKHSGEIPGYHCWSDFYTENTWVPVDISEAWKDPTKKDYFFGAHDENRVQFSVGRDIRLTPPQAGAPLNYFVYPYVESVGAEHKNVRNEFAFEDVNVARASAEPRP